MSLTPGSRLGAYDVLALIGVGGMGEVYRAKDSKLHREVALKVLPDLWANDPDRLARFQREAEVLASLNHPHIAAIYGLEEAAGVRALVLELVEGPTLADRIRHGPMPVDEVLPIARQISTQRASAFTSSGWLKKPESILTGWRGSAETNDTRPRLFGRTRPGAIDQPACGTLY